MTSSEHDVAAAWIQAGERLGIDVVAPFVLIGGDGRIDFVAHLPHFGGGKGVLLTTTTRDVPLRAGKTAGYFVSILGEPYRHFDRALFIDTLRDWGFSGPPDRLPDWYFEKMVVRLAHDSDGYPPVEFEGVWIRPLDESRGIVDDIPFFARNFADQDLVRFEMIEGKRRFVSVEKHSGNSLIRVRVEEGDDVDGLRAEIHRFGCETEFDGIHRLIAVSVRPAGDLKGLQAFLQKAQDADRLGFEEVLLFG